MDRYEGEMEWNTLDYPRTESYMAKRIGAYILDLSISAIISILILYAVGEDLSQAMTWLYIGILSGILNFLTKAILEAGIGKSIGKAFFGLMIVTPDIDPTFGQAIGRNITAIVPLLGPLADLIFGRSGSEDDRQKLSDSGLQTLVIEDIPVPVEEPKPRKRYREPVKIEEPRPKEKVKLDYRSMRVGHCPRCDAPYRVLPPDDPSFSGLWNHRCTWCNHLIREKD